MKVPKAARSRPSSQECVRLLRAQMEPVRKLAAASDATANRRYGMLKPGGG